MALTHPLLLLGLLLAGIPVVLHLMLRSKPKKLLFPALRLIQNRRKQNVQRLRLRHILLMLLRILVIALLVFAITRPKIPAGDYRPDLPDLLRFAGIVAIVGIVYFAVTLWWRRQRWPRHILEHRRTMLRYSTAALAGVLFLLAVAWPYGKRVAASIADPTIKAGQDVPVAAVFVFDTSLSMQYRQENRTRLDIAKEIADRHLSGFPAGSRAAVCDTAADAPIRLQSITATRSRLSQVETRPFTRLINDRLEAALQAQADDRQKLTTTGGAPGTADEQFAREIYVFTDLAGHAWRPGESPRLAQLFQELPGVHVYLIDVGVPAPQNLALTTLSLSQQTPAIGSELSVRATLESLGLPAGERTVQLFFENENGKLIDKGKSTVKVEPGQQVQVAFSIPNQSGTARQGELRLAASDPLAFDDVLSFSILVQPPPKVLVVSDRRGSADYVAQALAPDILVRTGKSRYQCKVVTATGMLREPLQDYVAVWLVNVENPTAAGWKKLREYVEKGGGLGVIVGSRVGVTAKEHAYYLFDDAKAVLPAELDAPKQNRTNRDIFLDLRDSTHPVLARFFADWGGVIELTSLPIDRYWRVKPADGSRVIGRFTDDHTSPALIARGVGQGQSLLLATAVDSPASAGRNSWNDLPTVVFKYVALLDQMTLFLSQARSLRFNHLAGNDVHLPLPESPAIEKYLLRKPNREQLPGDAPPRAKELVLRELDQLGNYRVVSTEPKIERGFSINADPSESRLHRLSESDLAAILPKDRYSISRSVETLDRKVRDGRIGREIYPLVVLLLAAVFVGEQFVANRFYGDEPKA